MATTEKLLIPLLDGGEPFRREAFNDAYQRMDEAALPIEHAETKAHFALWRKNTKYKKQDVVRTPTCPNWGFYMCTVAGTSGETEPIGYGEGDVIEDGTCTWTLRLFGGATAVSHATLLSRNLPDQHKIAAITGLQEMLDQTATKDELTKKITDLLNGAPEAYDTLKEIADALADDDTAIAEILNTLAKKVDKESGKSLSANDYTAAAKAKVDKLGEKNGKLTYNNSALVGGASLWQAGRFYDENELVVYENLLCRCKSAHTSNTQFERKDWDQLTVGYIPAWQADAYYIPGMVVTRGNSILRCITAHTSVDFSNLEKNYWEVLAGKGATLSEWQPRTNYEINEAVVYNDSIYRAVDAHTSGETFSGDMFPGNEKWRILGSGGSAGELKQITKLGVTAPKQVDIVINNTNAFNLPPVEVLKFILGAQNQVTTICAFDNADADDFIIDGVSGENAKYVAFDGTMKLNTAYTIAMSEPVALEDGFISESEELDFADYKKVVEVDHSQ